MKYSIIIPIYNEEKFLPQLINELKPLSNENEIIIIDDGSTDNSPIILNPFKEFIIIRNEKRLGKGSSVIKAISLAKEKYIALFDGDLEINTDELSLAISQHKINTDLIIKGNRFHLYNENVKSFYDIGNLIFNQFFNFLNGTNYRDIFCCLTIIDKKLIKSFNLKSKNFAIETEIMSNIAKKNLPLKEHNIRYHRRHSGKKLNFMHSLEILLVMINHRLK